MHVSVRAVKGVIACVDSCHPDVVAPEVGLGHARPVSGWDGLLMSTWKTETATGSFTVWTGIRRAVATDAALSKTPDWITLRGSRSAAQLGNRSAEASHDPVLIVMTLESSESEAIRLRGEVGHRAPYGVTPFITTGALHELNQEPASSIELSDAIGTGAHVR